MIMVQFQFSSWSEIHIVGNPEDRFSCDRAHIRRVENNVDPSQLSIQNPCTLIAGYINTGHMKHLMAKPTKYSKCSKTSNTKK